MVRRLAVSCGDKPAMKWIVSFCIGLAVSGAATAIDLEKPSDCTHVFDGAGLLNSADKAQVISTCERLMADRGIRIVVITIESMAAHGAASMDIVDFTAAVSFNWGEQFHAATGESSGQNILFLVSRDDRKAHIALGYRWKQKYSVNCQAIMDNLVVPNFKRGDYSAGIVAGVQDLDRMARGQRLRSAGLPWMGIGAAIILVVFLLFSTRIWRLTERGGGLENRGGTGYHGGGGAASGGGGSFGGGGGGGGGGGATGAW